MPSVIISAMGPEQERRLKSVAATLEYHGFGNLAELALGPGAAGGWMEILIAGWLAPPGSLAALASDTMDQLFSRDKVRDGGGVACLPPGIFQLPRISLYDPAGGAPHGSHPRKTRVQNSKAKAALLLPLAPPVHFPVKI